jgi:hypothetical protein
MNTLQNFYQSFHRLNKNYKNKVQMNNNIKSRHGHDRMIVVTQPRTPLCQLPYNHNHDGPCDNYHMITTTMTPVTTTI